MFLKNRHLFKHNNNKANPKAMLHLLTTKNNVIVRRRTRLTKLLVAVLLFGCSFVAQSQCPTSPGDQTSYGSGSWIGYVYNAINASNPPTNAFTTTYKGYITQPEIFNQDLGSGAVSGANLCGTYSDQFAIRFKMTKNFAPGNYSFQVGGDDGYRLSFDGGATFPISKWNDQGYVTTNGTYYLSGTTNLVLEYYEQGGLSRVSFSYGICSTVSTAPTSITGTTTICSGTSTTLTASGGTSAFGVTYEWGTGTTLGSNIIAGQTTSSITVSPTTSTTYWVRRVDPAPCALTTAGITQAVTVNQISTAPTSITGGTTLCLGSSATLTATGGTLATGSAYQWGTGTTVGSNIISGQTGVSITVTPSSTTTYWVRRVDTTPCANTTAGISTSVTVNIPTGDQTTYGSDSWIGYVYSDIDGANPPTNVFTANYRGYLTQPVTFDQDLTTTALSGTNICGTYADKFSIRYKMTKNFTAGYYTFTVGGDDGYRLSIDGGTTFLINNFLDHAYTTSTSATIYLSGNTNLVLEYYEQGGYSRVSFNYTACTNFSTAPTGVSGSTSLCYTAGGTTLTATGGFANPSTTYQWGTGNVVGSNIIAGATNVSYYINPSVTTTYWVRRVDPAPCNQTTSGFVVTVNVSTPSTMPTTVTSATTVCSGSSLTITASGGTLGTGGAYQWGTGYSAGTNIITGQTGASITINPTTTTSGYWVRRMDPAPCNTATGHNTTTVTVVNTSTAPTTISGTTSLCGSGSTTLTASGGTLGSTGSYQWGTGAVGTNIIAGQTAASITVSLTSTKTYWVRRVDSACSNTTSEVSQVVNVYTTTVAGTLSSTATTICANTTPNDIVLTGNNGTVVKWQSATNSTFTTGLIDIASTSTTLTGAMAGAISSTLYYRAVVQNGSCPIKYTTGIKITVPAAVTYNGSWSGTPTATTPVTISGNLTLTSDLNVCSCQVTGTAVITVPANKTLVVQKNISIASTANIVVENDGSLIQVDDNASTIGNITFKRNTTPLKQYDYTYWSSPLAGQTLSILGAPSFFYSFNPTINNWVYEVGTTTMAAAKGYIARVPNNLNFSTPQVVATTFNGTPNNGVINTPIIKMDDVTYNLIGNPYPSAIDIDAFLLDSANSNIVNGTIYMWTHNTAISNSIPGNQVYNYTRDDYAKYNLTGGVKTASGALSGGVTPTGKIAAGQGFFIEANSALANGSYQATFKNYMRVASNNNQFFKFTTNLLNSNTNQAEVLQNTVEKNRVWLNISNTDGAYDETLVGYITGATNDLDNLYDGKTIMGGNVVSLYSKLNTTDLAIQGKALPFDENDVIPLGIKTTISGNFTIALDNFDGLFENQNVYLFDKTNQTYYDLKAQSYTFNIATSGTYNDRFELRYTNGALANNAFGLEDNGIQIIRKDKHVAVKSTSTIHKIEVVDLLGKSMYSKSKINANEFNTSDLNISSQIVIVKVTLENDVTISRKVMMN